jgi:hypothetical protein
MQANTCEVHDGLVQDDTAEPPTTNARITQLIEQGRDREAAELGAAQLTRMTIDAEPDDEGGLGS